MKLICISLAFFCLLSCDNQDLSLESNNRIRESLDNRVAEYRSTLKAECRSSTIQLAVIYTDSMIAADYFMELSGTIPFPPKPIKPAFDGPIIIKDTIKASPILR